MATHKTRMTFFYKFLLIWLFSATLAFPGEGHIKGKILDNQTQEPLMGANIQILGTTRGTSANLKGEFEIKNIPTGNYQIRFSMIGYHTYTLENVKIRKGTKTLDVWLKSTPIEFDPIVVLAGKSKQRLDQAPVSLSVVSAAEIERRVPMNIVQALETAPGVNFIGDQINIRGSTGYTFGAGNKVLLLLDGVPVYASDTGEFNWDMISPADIKQIEIQKGAGSTLWGSSALGGVVNIITKKPSSKGQFYFSYALGKYDEPYYNEWKWTDHSRLHFTREDISYSKQFEQLGVRLSAGRYFTTGYTQLGDAQKYTFTGKFDYQFKNGMMWTGYTAYNYTERGFFIQWMGQNDPYEVDPSNLSNHAKVNQLNTYTKFSLPLSSKFALNFRASFVRTLMGSQFGSGAGFNPAIGQGVELQADWLPSKSHNITGGIQFQLDAGSTEYFGDHRGYFVGPYIQDEWKIRDDFRVTVGLRYDRYQLIDGQKEDLFSPRLGLNWKPWPTTSFRGSVGSGFRAATIVERFLELNVMNFKVLPNPVLKSERSWAYDIGCRHYFTDEWNLDFSVFNNEYWELIEAHLDLIRGQIQFRNIPRARIRGAELTINFSTDISMWDKMINPNIQASITAMDHQDLKWNKPLTYRPNVIGYIKGSIKVAPFLIGADLRYASKIKQVKVYPINERVPMKFFDLRLSYNWRYLTVQFAIKNLFQYNYASRESNLMPMRNYVLSLSGTL